MTNNATQNLLDQLADRAKTGLDRDKDEPFPPKWDPALGHPNPVVMEAFPAPYMPKNATSPLIEMTHRDGKRYTQWISNNLAQAILRAGTKVGYPCSIARSDTKHSYFSETLGYEVSAWSWSVETPFGSSAARGRELDVNDLAGLLAAGDDEADVVEAELVAEPSPVGQEPAADAGDLPSKHDATAAARGVTDPGGGRKESTTVEQHDAWARTPDGLIVCAGCFGGITGRHIVIGGLPYHRPMTSGFGKNAPKVRLATRRSPYQAAAKYIRISCSSTGWAEMPPSNETAALELAETFAIVPVRRGTKIPAIKTGADHAAAASRDPDRSARGSMAAMIATWRPCCTSPATVLSTSTRGRETTRLSNWYASSS